MVCFECGVEKPDVAAFCRVEAGEMLYEYSSDVLSEILVGEGQTVPGLTAIARIKRD